MGGGGGTFLSVHFALVVPSASSGLVEHNDVRVRHVPRPPEWLN